MDHIIALIATDASASDISDNMNSAIFNKCAERIDAIKPLVAKSFFGDEVTTEDLE